MATLISTALPDLDLEEKSVLTVDTGDPAAVITQVVIHFTQDVPLLPETFPPVDVLLGFAPGPVPG